MTDHPEEQAAPRPIFMGCALALMAIVAAVALIGGCIVFAESGANDGTVNLRDARSYAPGSIEYSGDGNFFIVRTLDGKFVILSDLDAANRANQAQRCRVSRVGPEDPAIAGLLNQYKTRISPEAGGATTLFRESCNNAVYDFLGTRVDSDGPNLERLGSTTNDRGLLVVDTRDRTCTERTTTVLRDEVVCPD